MTLSHNWRVLVSDYRTYRSAGWPGKAAFKAACKDNGVGSRSDRSERNRVSRFLYS